jgi:hypothetical protein
MAVGKPSKDYQYVLIPEDFDAFRSKAAAIRQLKRQWANQEVGQRVGWFIAKVEFYEEPDYEIKSEETPIEQVE